VFRLTEFVVWLGLTIEDAIDSKDAAQKAQTMIQRPGSKWLYKVIDSDTGKVSIVDFYGE
jgi:hypothetical protein